MNCLSWVSGGFEWLMDVVTWLKLSTGIFLRKERESRNVLLQIVPCLCPLTLEDRQTEWHVHTLPPPILPQPHHPWFICCFWVCSWSVKQELSPPTQEFVGVDLQLCFVLWLWRKSMFLAWGSHLKIYHFDQREAQHKSIQEECKSFTPMYMYSKYLSCWWGTTVPHFSTRRKPLPFWVVKVFI